MTDGPDRLAYLDGMVRYVNLLLDATRVGVAEPLRLDDVLECLGRIPFGADLVELVESEHGPVARARRDARTRIAFDPEQLGIALLDGRQRARRCTTYLATGPATPAMARVFAALQAGVPRSELLRLAGDEAVEIESLLADLRTRGQVEELEDDSGPAQRFARGAGDRLTWLGHAAVMVQSGATTIWVDPVLAPRIDWRAEDHAALFSNAFAESRLFEPYGPHAPQWTLHDLPSPDAVLITHQDCDHLDLGVLMALPDSASIVVPTCLPNRPWEVDIRALIARVLGSNRRVIQLAHGQSLRFGAVEVTAFPFRGEMPSCLPHSWNCYLLTTTAAAVAVTADSRLDAEGTEFLVRASRVHRRPLTLCAGPPRDVESMPGWREGLASTQLWASARLWGWYVPVWSLFQPTPCTNLNYAQLEELAAEAGLRYYFPYATGSTPWLRIHDPADAFYLPVASLDATEIDAIAANLTALGRDLRLFPGRYGDPTRIDRV